jgi:NIMA (never in mitosis gene a)-related kinase
MSANYGGARVVAAATTTMRGRGRRVEVEIADLRWGKVIGRGSHGVVRLARHKSSGKRFVVKLIPLEEKDAEDGDGDARRSIPGTMTEREAREVEAEARTLRLASSHPNVCAYHGCARRVDERTGRKELLIIMSHCEGGDVASLIRSVTARGEALPEDVVMRWVVQLLLALQHVHALGIIHRGARVISRVVRFVPYASERER